MRNLILAAAAAVSLSAMADEAPLWLRNVAISPDGTTVAFTYKGDVFTVPLKGGRASRLTFGGSYNTSPVWSPDGERIAFSSNREGSFDIFIIDACGGTPSRLTTNSGTETPLTFLNDSTVLFSANIQPSRLAAQGPFASQVYTVSTSASRPKLYSSIPAMAVSFNASGDMLYQDKKGYENAFRKHERSSGTSDIWLVDAKDGKYTKLTDFNGHDLNPVWTGDDRFVFISEEDGTLNVWSRNISGTEKRQLTKFTAHPVRSLSAANDGTLAFSWDGEIYTLAPYGTQPQKLSVSIVTDDYDGDRVKSFRSSGATTVDIPENGEEVAFVIRGEVYVTSTKYKTTRRITDTPAQERCVSFSPDGKTLAYDSERDGLWQLFTAKVKNPDEPGFAYATEIVEELLYKSDKAAQQPVFSPDGKKVAFLEDRTTLRVIDVESKAVTTALDGKYNYSYSDGDITFAWSPDSEHLLIDYIGVGGWNNTDIALVSIDGSAVIDLTESGYSDGNAKWALDGKAITYQTSRYGMRNHGSWGSESDIILMALDGEAWDDFTMTEEEAAMAEKAKDKDSDDESEKSGKSDKKKDKKKSKDKSKAEEKKPKTEYDLANRRYRMRRLTDNSSRMGDYYLSPKGDKLYYVARSTEDDYNLYAKDIRKDETKVLAEGVSGGFVADKDGENLFIISGSGLKKVELSSGTVKPVEFEAQYDRKPSLEREYIYDHMLRQVRDKFYDVDLHGVDWEMYGEHYRKFLPYINNNSDFAILLSEILGELNASHTGGRYFGSGSDMPTASLGAFFDEEYEGDGLLVAEVLPRGPLAAKKVGVVPGDVILSIDGKDIKAGADYFPVLEGRAGKKTLLKVRKADGTEQTVTVRPISNWQDYDMLYRRWVEHNQAVVDSVSGGRVGYVHIEGMDSPSFRTIFDEVMGKYRNCDAIIVDTRWNGGGWLHGDVANLLSGKEYAQFAPRGQYIGSEPFMQWNKPSVMLVNEANYSDAYGTPYVYQTLKIGDIVGAPVPGTMTAVWWESQIDPTIVFGIPEVTCLNMQGEPLENKQLNPEVIVYNNPEDVAKGIDEQLITAVKHLLQKVK